MHCWGGQPQQILRGFYLANKRLCTALSWQNLPSLLQQNRCSHSAARFPEATAGQSETLELEVKALDLTDPASWYPLARTITRKIVAHVGPTNSGKTYQALKAMTAAESGAYCGPLRLLAWEVAEKMTSQGLPCSLITGQEQRLMKGSKHIASTVEMANLSQRIKVGVIDEVQMLGDPLRGASYTRAILGLPAEELHLCGDPAAVPLLRVLAEQAGDDFQVKTYSRLAALRLGKRTLPDISHAQRGDCLVAFSRQEVHRMKQEVEAKGQHSCCVVYGALPPRSRAHQAILFNTMRTGYNVLAASDAVGMGLNLNIRRIVFSSLEKYDGKETRPLTPAEVKQIAGRAGRYGSKYCEGIVTCLREEDMPSLKRAMATDNTPTRKASVFPSFHQIAILAHSSSLTLAQAIQKFAKSARLSEHYFLGDYENMLVLASMLEHQCWDLSLEDCYTFAMSPTDSNESRSTDALMTFAKAYCKKRDVPGYLAGKMPREIPQTPAELKSLEVLHGIYDLYIWLSFRFATCFPDKEQVELLRSECSDLIGTGLENIGRKKLRTPKKPEKIFQNNLIASATA